MRRPAYDTVSVAAPFELAASRMRQPPQTWLPGPAVPLDGEVVVTMRASGLLAAAGVDALVHVDPPSYDREPLLVVPVAWRSHHVSQLFPLLTGDLELEAVSDAVCRLTLVGGYKPPVSVLGDLADRYVGFHVAEAVIRTFLTDVAEALAHT